MIFRLATSILHGFAAPWSCATPCTLGPSSSERPRVVGPRSCGAAVSAFSLADGDQSLECTCLIKRVGFPLAPHTFGNADSPVGIVSSLLARRLTFEPSAAASPPQAPVRLSLRPRDATCKGAKLFCSVDQYEAVCACVRRGPSACSSSCRVNCVFNAFYIVPVMF